MAKNYRERKKKQCKRNHKVKIWFQAKDKQINGFVFSFFYEEENTKIKIKESFMA